MCIHMYTYTHIYIYIYIEIDRYIYIYIYICTHYVFMYFKYSNIHIYIYMHIFKCVCPPPRFWRDGDLKPMSVRATYFFSYVLCLASYLLRALKSSARDVAAPRGSPPDLPKPHGTASKTFCNFPRPR